MCEWRCTGNWNNHKDTHKTQESTNDHKSHGNTAEMDRFVYNDVGNNGDLRAESIHDYLLDIDRV